MNSLMVLFVAALWTASNGESPNDSSSICNLGGQALWCSSVENARRCNMEEFCRTRCWSYFGKVDEFHRQYRLERNSVPRPELVEMCTGTMQLSRLRNALCSECKTVIRDLDSVFNNTVVLDSLLTGLRFACNFVPGYASQCRLIVNDIGSAIGHLEPHMRNPEAVCQTLRMCPHTDNTTSPLTSLFQKMYMPQFQQNGPNSWCDDCQKACGDIKQQLEDPAQQQSIKETFEDVCTFLGPLKRTCKDYMDKFVPQLIDWMISLFQDPQGLCSRLGFCQ